MLYHFVMLCRASTCSVVVLITTAPCTCGNPPIVRQHDGNSYIMHACMQVSIITPALLAPWHHACSAEPSNVATFLAVASWWS